MGLFNRCKHQWAVLDKTTMPSELENMKTAGYEITSGLRASMARQRVVLTLHCTVCGKLHQSNHATATLFTND